MEKKKILILANTSKPGLSERISAVVSWLAQRAEVSEILSVGQEVSPIPPADLCIVFGGDGSLLYAARMLAGKSIPILGVNMGKLGFLAEFSEDDLREMLDDILSGKIEPTSRMMLSVCIRSAQADGGQKDADFPCLAVNDIAISAGSPFRMIDLRVEQISGDQTCEISKYLGDGLVVSTPTGTTGYNLSAGGPIMAPTLDAMVITPVAPHTLSIRPIIVHSDRKIKIAAVRVNPGSAVIVDGQITGHLQDGDTVEVAKADPPAIIFSHPGRHFFQTLAEKMQWGKSPHHP